MMRTHKGAVRALVPLLVTSVSVSVVVAGALGGVGNNLIVLDPAVADAEGSAARGELDSVVDAYCRVVQIGNDSLSKRVLVIGRCGRI